MHRTRQYSILLSIFGAFALTVASREVGADSPPAASQSPYSARPFPGIGKSGVLLVDAVVLGPHDQFDTSDHSALFATLATQSCTKILGQAQWNQDIWHAMQASAHFDNCDFGESLDLIQDKLKAVDEHAAAARTAVGPKRNDELNAMVEALGQATHGIQDFYSHSNYLEQVIANDTDWDDALKLDLWSPNRGDVLLQTFRTGYIISGVVWYESPKLCKPDETTHAAPLTHAELNKDNDSSTEGKKIVAQSWAGGQDQHNVALRMAKDATVRFLQYAFRRWSELAEHCNDRIGVILTSDTRRQ